MSILSEREFYTDPKLLRARKYDKLNPDVVSLGSERGDSSDSRITRETESETLDDLRIETIAI